MFNNIQIQFAATDFETNLNLVSNNKNIDLTIPMDEDDFLELMSQFKTEDYNKTWHFQTNLQKYSSVDQAKFLKITRQNKKVVDVQTINIF